MPFSDAEGKDWLADRIVGHAPASILDIGVGAGTYAQLLRPLLPYVTLTGIEVHEPYVAMFDLDNWYEKLIIGDAREIDWPTVDVVIMGDVLEHMTYQDAAAMWDKARNTARTAVFASLPLGVHPQGAEFGNEHERHVHSWTHRQFMRLPGVVGSWRGRVLGCYEATPDVP